MTRSGTSLTANVEILGCKGNTIGMVYWFELVGFPRHKAVPPLLVLTGDKLFLMDLDLKAAPTPDLTHPEYPDTPKVAQIRCPRLPSDDPPRVNTTLELHHDYSSSSNQVPPNRTRYVHLDKRNASQTGGPDKGWGGVPF
ncbi:hypothetical protein J6590_069908 [Homalodisca vitripennis]|nr:hypothetical protein J6590_069908 [Homalodisca vitripennis]